MQNSLLRKLQRSALNVKRSAFCLLIGLSTPLIAATTFPAADTKSVTKDSSGNLLAGFNTAQAHTFLGNSTATFAAGSTLTLNGGLSGTPTSGALNLSALTLTFGAQSGSLLTNLNASNLTSGTVAGTRLPESATIYASDYGVIADDSTDNRAALQAALDAIPANGGRLVLPSGRMRVSGTLNITKPYVSISGAGPGTRSKLFEPSSLTGIGSRLVFTTGADGIRISPAQNAAATVRFGGITLEDFGISGTGRANGAKAIRAELYSGNPAIYGPTDDMLIRRVAIIDYEWGMYLVNTDVTKIQDCWVTELGNGIYLNGCLYSSVAGTCIADNSGFGIEVIGGVQNRIQNNTIVRNITRGVFLSAVAQGASVVGNAFQVDSSGGAASTYAYQLEASNSTSVAITGNVFRNSGVTATAAVLLSGTTSLSEVTSNVYGLASGVPWVNSASGAGNSLGDAASGQYVTGPIGSPGSIGGSVFTDMISSSRARLQGYNFTSSAPVTLEIQQAGGALKLGNSTTVINAFGAITATTPILGSLIVGDGTTTATNTSIGGGRVVTGGPLMALGAVGSPGSIGGSIFMDMISSTRGRLQAYSFPSGAITLEIQQAGGALKLGNSATVINAFGSTPATSPLVGAVVFGDAVTPSTNVSIGGGIISVGAYFEGAEQASSPAAPAANGFRIYAKDNGSGKTVLYVRFATGAEQQVAIEP